jgi:hypothetical protein
MLIGLAIAGLGLAIVDYWGLSHKLEGLLDAIRKHFITVMKDPGEETSFNALNKKLIDTWLIGFYVFIVPVAILATVNAIHPIDLGPIEWFFVAYSVVLFGAAFLWMCGAFIHGLLFLILQILNYPRKGIVATLGLLLAAVSLGTELMMRS